MTTPDNSQPVARNLEADVTTPSPKSVSNNSTDGQTASNTVTSSVIVNATLARSLEIEANKTTSPEEARRIEQQNLNDRILFTRRGFYSLVENRLNAWVFSTETTVFESYQDFSVEAGSREKNACCWPSANHRGSHLLTATASSAILFTSFWRKFNNESSS